MSRNALLLLGARLISAASTVLLLVYLGHTEGGDALGVAGIGLAMGALLSAVSDSGTASLLIREGARDPRKLGLLLVAMSLWRLAVTPVAALLAWLVIASTISIQPGAVFLIALGLAVQQFAELTRSVFVARQEMIVSSLHSAIENAVWLLVIVAFLQAGASLELAFAAGVAVFVVSTVIDLCLVAFLGPHTPSMPDRAMMRTLVRQIGPFAAFMIVGVAYSRVDTLLIGALVPTGALVAAGAYFSAVRLIAAMEYLPEAVARASYPRLARAYEVGRVQVQAELRPSASFLLVVAMPVPLLMFIGGPWVMTTLFGPDVAPYAWVVVPLALVVPLRFLSYLFGMALTSTDEQGRRVFAVLVALALVLILDVILIPTVGIAGAVVGSLAASVCVFVVYSIPVIRHVGHLGLVGKAIRHLSVVVGLGIVGNAVISALGPPATVLLVAVAYAVVALAVERAATGRRLIGFGS